jgi:virginiamycin B lyase
MATARSSFLSALAAACIGVLAVVSVASCDSLKSAALPGGAATTSVRNVIVATRGTVTLYPDRYGDALPTAITAGPDGALWFTDEGDEVIGRITTDGTYTLQKSTGGAVSDGITTGPDGNLWFTGEQRSASVIGRITTRGALKFFADTGGSVAAGITTGPDGALWFAESNGMVGRMTTKGKVTHFTVAPRNASLQGIVAGPDGNLWVTQYIVRGIHFSNQVIRVTTSGRYKSYTVGSGPDFICVGPDKALWFTEGDANAIGRLTTDGKLKQFPSGNQYAQPSGIATGPDGALWFTDFSGVAGIGRMTTSGKVQFYKAQGSFARLVEITAGPDGAMWFTAELGPPAIGRVTTH